jgi:hypothetical protein
MAEEGRNLSLVILGIVAIIAVVGLVLLLSGGRAAKTGNIVNVPALDGLPGCDSPCTPALLGPYTESTEYQVADFEQAFGKKCVQTGYEDPRYAGSGPLWCCCPTKNSQSILRGDSSVVQGPPFNMDSVPAGRERDSRIPVMGGYEIER